MCKDQECLGTISGNCHIVDGLQQSIKYSSRTCALLQKGIEKINVFTWPGAEAGHVAEPLSGALKKLLTGTSTYRGQQHQTHRSYGHHPSCFSITDSHADSYTDAVLALQSDYPDTANLGGKQRRN
ncbi:uncharacterized protein VP01_1268g6 [Puccinia sorghi]|uniref:Uncharacterized protein n=1 Tax=Puccinia sorghi TaxID=27349 RepID=A0A0L6VPB3_9BASI|nr:uncharacterized protein VP01_1268g6 [Puccinia sorghi]